MKERSLSDWKTYFEKRIQNMVNHPGAFGAGAELQFVQLMEAWLFADNRETDMVWEYWKMVMASHRTGPFTLDDHLRRNNKDYKTNQYTLGTEFAKCAIHFSLDVKLPKER